MSTSWEYFKREFDKTLWVYICQDRSPKNHIAIEINKWWQTRYPTYKIRICNKATFQKVMKGE